MDLEEDYVESTGLQTPLSSPARSRVIKLRRTLRDSNSPSTFSSPPTEFTQVNSPLCSRDDGPPDSPSVRPSPHFTFTSNSSRAYPSVSNGRFAEVHSIQEVPRQLEVEDWDSSSSSTPSPSESHPSAEEHTSRAPRCVPLHPEPSSRSRGVEYRSLTDLAAMERVDPRIWLPKSRVFDPDKVKPRPLTRPPSPVKRDVSPIASHESVSLQPSPQIPSVHSPFVRAGRGRHIKLAPSLSLPIWPDRDLDDECSLRGPRPTQRLENHRAGKGKEKELDYSARGEHPGEQPAGYNFSGRSHVQLVSRNSRNEQSAIVVHCPLNCLHETCYHPSLELPVSGIQHTRSIGPRYVDACVSPIINLTGRIQGADSPAKIRSKRPDLGDDHPYELAGFTHVSHQGIAPESDVRSPIVKGTMVPMNAIE